MAGQWIDLPAISVGNTSIVPSGSFTVKSVFNSITSVSSGILTQLISFTAPIGKKDYISQIEVSGSNIAQYEVFINSVQNASQRTYFGGGLNAVFNYGIAIELGYLLNSGDNITVKVIHNRPFLGDFESRILYVEQ